MSQHQKLMIRAMLLVLAGIDLILEIMVDKYSVPVKTSSNIFSLRSEVGYLTNDVNALLNKLENEK